MVNKCCTIHKYSLSISRGSEQHHNKVLAEVTGNQSCVNYSTGAYEGDDVYQHEHPAWHPGGQCRAVQGSAG